MDTHILICALDDVINIQQIIVETNMDNENTMYICRTAVCLQFV